MTRDLSPNAVLSELARHPRGDDLARLVHTAAFAAADERRKSFKDGLDELAERAGLSADDAETPFGNVLQALQHGHGDVADSPARILIGTLLSRAVAQSPPQGGEAAERVAETLIWLATHTPVDALGSLDAAMGERAMDLWVAVGNVIRKADAGSALLIGRAGALIAAAALRSSSNTVARVEVSALASQVHDPALQLLFSDRERTSSAADPERTAPVDRNPSSLDGQLTSPPRHPIVLVLLAITGILIVLHIGRLLGRLLLQYRSPTVLEVSAQGVTIRSKKLLFGRTLTEREIHFPTQALLRVCREVKYPRLALVTGLVALGLGTYIGVSLFVDGARAGSPELLGMGALFLAVGVALDFALSHLATTTKSRCRIVVVPRKGAPIAVGQLDPALADAALNRLLG